MGVFANAATLLVDGDEYLFKATSVVEREVQWDEENHTLSCNEREAWDNFVRLLNQLQEVFDTDDVVLCFSGKRPYFREWIFPSYKSGRSLRKPLCYATLREKCNAEYCVRAVSGIEADDVMGILATKPDAKHSIIVSQDKDMETVPGFWSKDGKDVQVVDVTRAARFHYLQTLTGDKTDSYPGCPGFGPTLAEKHLAADTGVGLPWSWERVLAAYEKRKLGANHALTQARVAKILTWDLWDTNRKEPILWQPTMCG